MNKIESKFQRVEKMIEKYPQAFQLGPGASEFEIDNAERHLKITFPPMYRRFLKQYSYLVTKDESIWGISPKENKYDVVVQTNNFNEELSKVFTPQLPSPLFVVQGGEFDLSLICLDTSAEVNNGIDAKVCVYPPEPIGPENLYESFTELFYEVCQSAVSTYLDERPQKDDEDFFIEQQTIPSSNSAEDTYDMAKRLILEHPELSELGRGHTDQQIDVAENSLGVKFKGSYVTFLKEFGGGMFGENRFFSLEDNELVETNRQLYHPTDYEHGLSRNLVAIYYDDLEDFYACLDFKNERDGEPTVVYRNANVPEEDYDENESLPSFAAFLHYIIKDIIEIES